MRQHWAQSHERKATIRGIHRVASSGRAAAPKESVLPLPDARFAISAQAVFIKRPPKQPKRKDSVKLKRWPRREEGKVEKMEYWTIARHDSTNPGEESTVLMTESEVRQHLQHLVLSELTQIDRENPSLFEVTSDSGARVYTLSCGTNPFYTARRKPMSFESTEAGR